VAKSKRVNNINPANPSNGNNAGMKPPAAPEIEASVLGAMMIEKEAVPKALELLKPESFYLTSHRLIYEAMLSLFESSEPIDTVTLYEELKKREQIDEVGGAVYLSQLSQNISISGVAGGFIPALFPLEGFAGLILFILFDLAI